MARDVVTETQATERATKRGNFGRRAGRAVGSGKMRGRRAEWSGGDPGRGAR